ncbi:MAG: sulfurtransferase TusA family protein, partial [Candidatus Omnitrophota bacterium]|nr:sulfurtransferase TusA family protein [Candidatus Omnitrophota bacterium]
GQQPLGKISFYGMVRKVDGRPLPFYMVHLGGRKEGPLTKLAKEIGVIPAKGVTNFLRDFLKKAESAIGNGDIYQFLEGQGEGIAKEVLKKHLHVPTYSENRDFYIDWGKKEDFSLAGLAPGECGAGVLDMIESDLAEGSIAIEEAEKEDYPAEKIKKALLLASRALLVVKGRDPKTEKEVFSDFRERFIDGLIASGEYSDVEKVFNGVSSKTALDERKEAFLYAKGFFAHIKDLYGKMDPSFNFPVEKTTPTDAPKEKNMVLDLKGTPCPINYVKAKLFLENIDQGDIVDIFLDEGEPIQNVSMSLKNDGHQILEKEKQNGFYKLVVKKQ